MSKLCAEAVLPEEIKWLTGSGFRRVITGAGFKQSTLETDTF